MKNLILFDSENFNQKTVSKNIGKIATHVASHIKLYLFLSVTVFLSVTLILSFNLGSNHRHYKSVIAEMQQYTDSALTIVEKDELCYATGLFYLENVTSKPSKDTVYNFIKSCNPWFAEYIMAQYIIESTSGTSDVAKNANNLFGMKKISEKGRHRPTTQIPGVDYNGYGMYKNWQLSVIDRILWELWRFKDKKPSETNYVNSLYRYAEAEHYVEIIKSVAKKYKNK